MLNSVRIAAFTFIFIVRLSFGNGDHLTYYTTLTKDGLKEVRLNNYGETWLARAAISHNTFKTGWIYLEIETNPELDDDTQAYEAGYIEGFITQKQIFSHWYNTWRTYCDGREKTCKNIDNFFENNTNYVNSIIQRFGKTDFWWHHANLYYKQLDGITDGYQKAAKHPKEKLMYKDLFMMNMLWDLDTLVDALADPDEIVTPILNMGHCSAIIKVLPGYEDLLVGHNTWTGYNMMLRIMKKYNITLHITANSNVTVPGNVISFSSYPGTIVSGDDFNVISSGLVTMETTNEVYDKSLWQYVTPERRVMESIRSVIANRLATSARDWRDKFVQANSGTYNNQWMVIDYNKFKKGVVPIYDLLWVIEQMPGIVFSTDVTSNLKNSSYWASYNVPYFEYIYNVSGYYRKAEEFGDWYSYDNNPRALIFKRDHKNIVNEDSLMYLMRYNDYLQDPLSTCDCSPEHNACNSIAARCDLNPQNGTYNIPNLKHRMHGAIDAKITNSEYVKSLQITAVSGPTTGTNLPNFQWTKVPQEDEMPHLGHPDLWDFQPETYNWVFQSPNKSFF